MRVKFRRNAAAYGFGYGEGAIADLSDNLAKKALGACADPVKNSVETTTLEKGETATAPPQELNNKEALRDAYEEKFGKKAPGRMSEEKLKEILDEA